MIKYKKDVLETLKDAGWTSYRLRQEKVLGESMLQKIRDGRMMSWEALDRVCRLLGCQPGDIIEYVDDKRPEA